MNIETVDDIIDDLADKMGIYGACKSADPDGCDNDDFNCCRVGFAMVLKDRIYRALENEQKLTNAGLYHDT